MPGTLAVVATPIGNLEDITLRALRVLKEADLIAAEDTRHSRVLLQHYGIGTPTTSFHEHNEREKLPWLLGKLAGGMRVALITDAGTPGVSDPGFRLVRAAREAGIPVEAVPGASAALVALVASGLPSDAFVFEGFPPNRGNARIKWVQRVGNETRTVVFFESPHRIQATLQLLLQHAGDRHVVVARELTKLHETLVEGPISAVLANLGTPRGEYTVVIAGNPEDPRNPPALPDDSAIRRVFDQLTNTLELSRRQIISKMASDYGVSAKVVYEAVERTKH